MTSASMGLIGDQDDIRATRLEVGDDASARQEPAHSGATPVERRFVSALQRADLAPVVPPPPTRTSAQTLNISAREVLSAVIATPVVMWERCF
jgi:hypothetical protein